MQNWLLGNRMLNFRCSKNGIAKLDPNWVVRFGPRYLSIGRENTVESAAPRLLGAFARLPQATVDRCVKDVPEVWDITVSPHLVLSAVFRFSCCSHRSLRVWNHLPRAESTCLDTMAISRPCFSLPVPWQQELQRRAYCTVTCLVQLLWCLWHRVQR